MGASSMYLNGNFLCPYVKLPEGIRYSLVNDGHIIVNHDLVYEWYIVFIINNLHHNECFTCNYINHQIIHHNGYAWLIMIYAD